MRSHGNIELVESISEAEAIVVAIVQRPRFCDEEALAVGVNEGADLVGQVVLYPKAEPEPRKNATARIALIFPAFHVVSIVHADDTSYQVNTSVNIVFLVVQKGIVYASEELEHIVLAKCLHSGEHSRASAVGHDPIGWKYFQPRFHFEESGRKPDPRALGGALAEPSLCPYLHGNEGFHREAKLARGAVVEYAKA